MCNPFRLIRSGYRLAKTFLRKVFLVTLPFTLFYFILGGIAGYILADYHIQLFISSTAHFYQNVRGSREMDWYSVPGGPGIHDVGLQPFWVPQLRDPSNWWVKLGLSRFDALPIFDESQSPPFDHFAWLDSLYRKTNGTEEDACWHHWVYASNQSFHFEDMFLDEWDSAFNELQQYYYANTTMCNTEFHYITCPGSFFCDVWQTRGPAFIHFTTETANLWPYEDQPRREIIPGYAPVIARIIEFPITKPGEMALMPGVFPSPLNQMKSITGDRHIWQKYNPWSRAVQESLRTKEVVTQMTKAYPSSLGLFLSFESWLSYYIIKDSRLDAPAIIITQLGMMTIYATWRFIDLVWDVLHLFSGTGPPGTEGLDVSMQEEAAKMPGQEPNLVAQRLRDFFDSEDGSLYEKLLQDTPEGREVLDRLWGIAWNGSDKKDGDESDTKNEEVATES